MTTIRTNSELKRLRQMRQSTIANLKAGRGTRRERLGAQAFLAELNAKITKLSN